MQLPEMSIELAAYGGHWNIGKTSYALKHLMKPSLPVGKRHGIKIGFKYTVSVQPIYFWHQLEMCFFFSLFCYYKEICQNKSDYSSSNKKKINFMFFRRILVSCKPEKNFEWCKGGAINLSIYLTSEQMKKKLYI